ncbi:hypothetical protein QVD17_25114 [Tagetes erecta]|uniref:Uncharacterized protein n=1 Tax=Tagetes erecta TaxID=13708 RepID=A0AAD8NN22_TARER|nr:hypothetical protein QVD17_25114 [Tagetes erecta]
MFVRSFILELHLRSSSHNYTNILFNYYISHLIIHGCIFNLISDNNPIFNPKPHAFQRIFSISISNQTHLLLVQISVYTYSIITHFNIHNAMFIFIIIQSL